MGLNNNYKKIVLSLVVPVFNEEDAVSIFISRITEIFSAHKDVKLEIIFVNDGSEDQTLNRLQQLQSHMPFIKIVDLSRNFGKEAALTAGLEYSNGDVVVPIDVDLQDPPELILEMLKKWNEGYEVVLAHRVDRQYDTFTKKISASLFYKLHNRLAWPKIPENVGDFRLMDKCVVEALKTIPESRRFMKGIFAWLGFRTYSIDYSRPQRANGNSKFSIWHLWNLALEAITSFSTAPLRVWTYIGFFVSFISFSYAAFITLQVLLLGIDLPGYASIIVAITFLGGLQLIGIGVLGEYLGRTYIEAKRRPTFIIRKVYLKDKEIT